MLVYQIGYVCEDTDQRIAAARLREKIRTILEATGANQYKIYLSDSKDNFRLKLYPKYKANRTQPKPKHYEFLMNLLVSDWDAEVAMCQEADDAMGIEQTRDARYQDTIICTIDKDLDQIPGMHYNWDKKELYAVGAHEGMYRFYYQLLVGDSSDNIIVGQGLSCRLVGAKRAQAMLEGCESEEEMFTTCRDAYFTGWHNQGEFSQEDTDDKLLLTGRLVKIRQQENEIWNFPLTQKQEQDQSSGYSLYSEKVSNPCWEHTEKKPTTCGIPAVGPEKDSTLQTSPTQLPLI